MKTLFSILLLASVAQADFGLPEIETVPNDVTYKCKSEPKGSAYWFDVKKQKVWVGDTLEANEVYSLDHAKFVKKTKCNHCYEVSGNKKMSDTLINYEFIFGDDGARGLQIWGILEVSSGNQSLPPIKYSCVEAK